jgi:6-phosphogluconolactonase/glucosamine-6-phosphate isomerase/deaminase
MCNFNEDYHLVLTTAKISTEGRRPGDNIWLSLSSGTIPFARPEAPFEYNVLDSEEAVGRAMFDELVAYAAEKPGDITLVLLGGRGAQAMYGIIREKTEAGEIDDLLGRLHVFTQDALAPMRMANGLSFVRDFERLLGPVFFARIKSFTPMLTETDDIEGELRKYVDRLESLGGIDLFFLGLGPEAEAASHLCYIKPGCGARLDDFAGIIPISPSILEHHISKFKVGGSDVSSADEDECRRAKYILTLGPAAILGAKRIVQSIVDASTAPAKKASFKRLIETEFSANDEDLALQTDENPGLLIRLHPDVRSYVLPDLVA